MAYYALKIGLSRGKKVRFDCQSSGTEVRAELLRSD